MKAVPELQPSSLDPDPHSSSCPSYCPPLPDFLWIKQEGAGWYLRDVQHLAFSTTPFPTEDLLKKEDRESWKDLMSQVQREPITPGLLRDSSK